MQKSIIQTRQSLNLALPVKNNFKNCILISIVLAKNLKTILENLFS